MLQIPSPATLLAAALASAAAAVPFLPSVHKRAGLFAVEARMASSAAGRVEVYYDRGGGFDEADASSLPLSKGAALHDYRLPLPTGTFKALRFDPIDREGTVTIESARIVDAGGRVVRDLKPSDFKPAHQIASLASRDGRLQVVVSPGGDDPQLLIAFSPPLHLDRPPGALAADFLKRAGGIFLGLLAALVLLAHARRLREALAAGGAWIVRNPTRGISIAAAAAAIASSYPVVFLGKSFVSPNLGTTLLYDGFPTLPGAADAAISENQGSDVGATLWQFVPMSALERRALVRDGELPLWNRYDSAGTPLLGQGYSMFGDPLHVIPLAAGGAAWAWDLKFLAAKALFAAGLGLLVFAIARHRAAALIVAGSAPFIGFFVYRINHPAFFSLCYAPWPLYCWVRAVRARGARAFAGWAAGLMLANFAVLNSGTVKEAGAILVAINGSGACALLAAEIPWRARLARLAGMAWAGILFAMASAPVWTTFFQALKGAATVYDAPSAYQVQPALMLGAFDEAFFRPLFGDALVWNPSANFLILGGVLYFLATLRHQFSNREVTALATCSLVPLAMVFGMIPPGWIEGIPYLANVAHIDDCFLCPLIVLWTVLAGVGFATAAGRLGTKEGRSDLAIAGLLLFALVLAWIGFGQAAHRSGAGSVFAPIRSGAPLRASGFVRGYLAVLLAALAALALTARRALSKGRLTPASSLVIALCGVALLWRNGMQASAVGFEDYVVHPGAREDFRAPSPAAGFVRKADAADPGRVVGLQFNLTPGWSGMYGLEGISGPEALFNPAYFRLANLAPLQRISQWRLFAARSSLTAALPFLDFLNVRHYLDLDAGPAGPDPRLKRVFSGDLDVFESPAAWPRAFFVDRVETHSTPAQLVKRIEDGDGRPFASVRADRLAETPGLAALAADPAARTVVPATRYRLTENATSFDIRAPGPGIVVLQEAWWPGYPHAEVDGRRTHLVGVNEVFQGIVVDRAGDYRMTVTYRPPFLTAALWISGASLALIAASFALVLREERRGFSPGR